jgi:hypothetical protein
VNSNTQTSATTQTSTKVGSNSNVKVDASPHGQTDLQ